MSNQNTAKNRAPMRLTQGHMVLGHRLLPPFPEGLESAIFGFGCFWGAESRFWKVQGVYTTAVGYAGGNLEHPTYQDVCSGTTGHAEVVLVIYDPKVLGYEKLLKVFWDASRPGRARCYDTHDQYRSVIYTTSEEQEKLAWESYKRYEKGLQLESDEPAALEISTAPTFYYAEQRHQQYQAKR